MQRTKISYLTHTWNPIKMRCTPISPACDHCWHLAMCNRLAANPRLPAEWREAYAGGPFYLDESELVAPTHLRKPAVIGVQFMGDLFHESIPFSTIEQIWNVMYYTAIRYNRRHTFVVLTKRPERAREFFSQLTPTVFGGRNKYVQNPLANVIGMVTAENQGLLNRRVPILLDLPFYRRGVSIEPMLTGVKVFGFGSPTWGKIPPASSLNWVIAGPETGPGARGLAQFENRARNLRDQCVEVGVSFFLKKNVDGTNLLDGQEWQQYPPLVQIL